MAFLQVVCPNHVVRCEPLSRPSNLEVGIYDPTFKSIWSRYLGNLFNVIIAQQYKNCCANKGCCPVKQFNPFTFKVDVYMAANFSTQYKLFLDIFSVFLSFLSGLTKMTNSIICRLFFWISCFVISSILLTGIWMESFTSNFQKKFPKILPLMASSNMKGL